MSFDGGTCDSWGLVGGIAIGYGFALLNIVAVMVVTMDWLFGYLLFGFAVSWIGTHIMKFGPNPKGRRWELAATVLWPLTLLIVCATRHKKA